MLLTFQNAIPELRPCLAECEVGFAGPCRRIAEASHDRPVFSFRVVSKCHFARISEDDIGCYD